MKKVLLLAVMSLFLGAGAANACDGHAKAKTTKADKASVATTSAVTAPVAKKDCSDADKAACATKATKTAGKSTPDCCASKKGAKMTEGATKTATTQAKL